MKYFKDQEQPQPMHVQQDLQQNLNEHHLQQELRELLPNEHHLQQEPTELPPQQKKRNTTVSHAAPVAKKSRLASVASLIEKATSCVDTK